VSCKVEITRDKKRTPVNKMIASEEKNIFEPHPSDTINSSLTLLSIIAESFAPVLKARASLTVKGGGAKPSTVFTLT